MLPGTKNKTLTDYWFYVYPILFALAYSQKPLFTFNQNTKFISGLAHAGYRDVSADWMAQITDPFPLFSGLLQLQHQLLGVFAGVHLSFLLIVALYGITGIWLAKNFLAQIEGKQRMLLIFSCIWLIVHSSELREIWLNYFPDGLADQYILRSFYQPTAFGVLLLTGATAYISGRLQLAAVLFILAPLFHPTYLIPSALIATTLTVLPANRSLGISRNKRIFFLSLVLFALTPYAIWCINSLSSGDPLIQEKAHQLLAEVRIPHHANPLLWEHGLTAKFFLVGLAASWFGRKWIIGQLIIVMLLFIAVTMLWAIIAPNPTLGVLAPWRLSVIIAPLCWIVVLATAARWLTGVISNKAFSSYTGLGWAFIIIVIGITSSIGIYRFYAGYHYKKTSDYYAISRFIETYHEPGSQYLIPIDQMNIRLEAGVPVFVTWKSHPTKDSEFLEWYKRIQAAQVIYDNQAGLTQSEMLVLKEKFSVTHVIWPTEKGDFPFLKMGSPVYSDKYFSLWDMR
ncbi:MAG: DUF6798 domain-containing protein [Arenicellales bacterium]